MLNPVGLKVAIIFLIAGLLILILYLLVDVFYNIGNVMSKFYTDLICLFNVPLALIKIHLFIFIIFTLGCQTKMLPRIFLFI